MLKLGIGKIFNSPDGLSINILLPLYPTYYIKAENEVDIAYIDKKHFWPIEIKWAEQLHSKELKQIKKYRNSRILTQNHCPWRCES